MTETQNPFFENIHTPHGTVPFDHIAVEHYAPAIRRGLECQNEEIDAIVNNPEPADFHNTILALEKSGQLLHRVEVVFDNLLSAETNDAMQELAKELMPLLSEHANNITLNERLFERVKTAYEHRNDEPLTAEQRKLTEDTYEGFVRSGANLQGANKEKYRELSRQLSLLTLQFSENNLKETNDYQLVLTDEAQLKGLPQSAIDAAAETAREKQQEGWVFTLHAPSYVPFLAYAADRDLRKEIYMAYNTKCTHANACNNLDIVKQLVNTRLALAQLLGYKDYATYKLERRMAQNSANVYHLLDQLLEAYKPTAQKEYAEVQALAREEQGADFTLSFAPILNWRTSRKAYSAWPPASMASLSKRIPTSPSITRTWRHSMYSTKTAASSPYSIRISTRAKASVRAPG